MATVELLEQDDARQLMRERDWSERETVVDVVEQTKSEVGANAAWIHVEIYNKNNPNDGFRPQVKAFRLPTEPWTFVIDRSGRVVARFDGAMSVAELKAAVSKVA